MHRLLCLLLPLAVVAADPTAKLKLAFSEEFDGAALDAAKWTHEGNAQAASLKGGKLVLTLIDRADGWQGTAISTRDKFTQLHGYFEASIRFNAQRGHHGAFLVRNKLTTEPPVASLLFECFGEDRLVPWARIADSKGLRELKPVKTDLTLRANQTSKAFNTYGFAWTEKAYVWYFNGKAVHKLDKPEVNEPMHVYLGNWVGDSERKNLVPSKLPDDVEVDWVKVWK
ncbi:MAG: Glucan endo,3-beta-glucosidase precursor [Verrucomicrobiota bacterium]|jgi:beta-glucanase (GH16 family)